MRVLDLFSGVGMFAYGMEKAGHEVVAFCEIEEWPRRVLRKHWPDVPIYEDVRELNRERLEAKGVRRVDVITGGFPCQDLSVAGKQAGIRGERSGLFDEIIRLARELGPRYIILENVATLLTGSNGDWARYVFGSLTEIGFDAEWHVIPAGDANVSAGAPHRRERVWVVAYPSRNRRKGFCKPGESKRKARPPEGQAAAGKTGDRNPAGGERQPFANMGLLAHGVTTRLARSRWLPEPGIGRVATGVPDRVQKLKALGNGLVWQIPYAIGCAIQDAE